MKRYLVALKARSVLDSIPQALCRRLAALRAHPVTPWLWECSAPFSSARLFYSDLTQFVDADYKILVVAVTDDAVIRYRG